MNQSYKDVADRIFERGAFKFGAFKLKHHEKNPEAPLSPFYINLRTKDNPTNPGPLTGADCFLIAEAMWSLVKEKELCFSVIAGIPYAGDPIVEAFESMVLFLKTTIKLDKEIGENYRKIIPLEGFDLKLGERTLLIDDLVTKANSKIEAIRAIESLGLTVNDLVVLIDRQQGGRKQLKEAGYNLHSCFTITELLEYYLSKGKISSKKFEECLDYIINN